LLIFEFAWFLEAEPLFWSSHIDMPLRLFINKRPKIMATAVAPTPMYIYIIGKLSTIGVNATVGLTLTVSMHGTIAPVYQSPWN